MEIIENTLAYPDSYASIVQGIQNDQPEAGQALYQHIITALQRFMYAHLGAQDYRDAINDVYIDLVTAIKNGSIREPDRIKAYAWTVARGRAKEYLRRLYRSRNQDTPAEDLAIEAAGTSQEEALLEQERRLAIRSVLHAMSPNERGVLAAIHLDNKSAEQIQQEMGLTYNQFRHIKQRAQAKLIAKCKRSIDQ